MVRIIVNGRFLLHRITGVERYAHEILNELDKIIRPGEIEMAIPPGVKEIPQYKNIAVKKTGILKNQIWEQISFPLYVIRKKAVSMNLCNTAPLFLPGIVCIHDVKIKARPQDFSKCFLLWYNLLFFNISRRAKKIITVSEFSKKEICKYYHVDPKRIEVIPNAWQHYDRIAYDERVLEKYGLEKDQYFFAMSSLEPNKNIRWIAETARKMPGQMFVVAGSVNKKIFAEGIGFACPDNMKLIGYVSDGEAKALMRDCRAFLFPTFYEGFGIPPLEALSAGAKHVVVSDTEIMHEIFGESVHYIDPDNCSTGMREINFLHSTDIRYVLERYSWKKSAIELENVIDELTL